MWEFRHWFADPSPIPVFSIIREMDRDWSTSHFFLSCQPHLPLLISITKGITNNKTSGDMHLEAMIPHTKIIKLWRTYKKGENMFRRIIPTLIITTLLLMFMVSISHPAQSADPPNQVIYSEKTFANGKMHHFTYKTGDGIVIRYFILKSSDGVIRAAFDACDVCWPENKGYSQKGDSLVCNNCGKRFPSTRVNEVRGGCNPAPLKRKMENGNVIIQVADILDGKKYFNFKEVKR
jgi:hypothetical protein